MREDEGLFMRGAIISRQKKMAGKESKELAAYVLLADGRECAVKHWDPCGENYPRGECRCFPLSIKINSYNGHSSLEFSVKKARASHGKDF
ncbi:MAG: hypothetical protein LBU32_08235 [Clostridiales bacterium]|jgi:hypothetical protein|nr:hypothetical protein [Clostridiales bacterium]